MSVVSVEKTQTFHLIPERALRTHRGAVICAYTSYSWCFEGEGTGRFGGLGGFIDYLGKPSNSIVLAIPHSALLSVCKAISKLR